MTDNDDSNNEVYRLIKAAFNYQRDDLHRIWVSVGFDKYSPNMVARFWLAKDNESYLPLYPGKLKKWLYGVCVENEITISGMSIKSLIGDLCDYHGVQTTGCPVVDAKKLRDSMLNHNNNPNLKG
jgi:hypothetical protein